MSINGYNYLDQLKISANRRVLSCMKDGQYYAMKEFSKGNYHQYYLEIYIIKQLKEHRNIVKLQENFEEGDKKYIVLEYCHQDLKTFLNENLNLSQLDRLLLFAQIVSAFKAIHDDLKPHYLTFEHRDIKPENLMLGLDNQLKIIDFGESRINEEFENDDIYDIIQCSTHICGTPGYVDPLMEYFNQGFTNKSDIWSLGATLFYIMTNKELKIRRELVKNKPGTNGLQKDRIRLLKMASIQSKINEYLQEIKHENCKKLLENMLNMDIQERYGWPELFNDKFVVELWIIINNKNNEFRASRKKQAPAGHAFHTSMLSTFFYHSIGDKITQLFKFIIRKGQLYFHTAQKMFELFQDLKEYVGDFQLNWQNFEKCHYLLHLKALYVFNVYSLMLVERLQKIGTESINLDTYTQLMKLQSDIYDRISIQIFYLFHNVEKRLSIGLETRIIQLQKNSLREETSEYSQLLELQQDEINYFPSPNKKSQKLSLDDLQSPALNQLLKQYLIQCLEVLIKNQIKKEDVIIYNLIQDQSDYQYNQSQAVVISNLITCYGLEELSVSNEIQFLTEKKVANIPLKSLLAAQKTEFQKIKLQNQK